MASTAGITPSLSLRGASALDDHASPPPFDPEEDAPTSAYLEKHYWGLAHLDAGSWKYYLPVLCNHALSNIKNANSNAVGAFLQSLRPPDREPPRFASLSEDEKRAVVSLLDRLAFDDSSAWQQEAITALEEYWGPGAIYRNDHEI